MLPMSRMNKITYRAVKAKTSLIVTLEIHNLIIRSRKEKMRKKWLMSLMNRNRKKEKGRQN